MDLQAQPRGLRLNNPLCIRKSKEKWIGKVPSNDPDFEQFCDIFHGIRAALVILRTYTGRKYKFRFVSDIIRRWAPARENNTKRYIDFVLKKSCIKPAEIISFSNKNQICRLAWAMAAFECGVQVPFNYFERAYAMV